MKKYLPFCLAICCSACNNVRTTEKDVDIANPIDSFEVIQTFEPKVLSAEDVYNNVIGSVALVMSLESGIPFSQGSGFFIDPNTLITNYHVVAGSDAVQIKMVGNEKIFKGARVDKVSETFDLAIVKTEQDFPYLSIDTCETERIGSKIYTIGNPRGLEGTLSDGILSGRRDNDGIEYIQITAPISPGNSGGPLLNDRGEVIGVSTMTFRNSQNLNFAMPIKYIEQCNSDYVPLKKKRGHEKKTENTAVTMTNFDKKQMGSDEFFSLKNNTQDDICAVTAVLVYKTRDGEVIDYRLIDERVNIPVGLAKRMTYNSFDQHYNWCYIKSENYDGKRFDVEFRLLSYEIVE